MGPCGLRQLALALLALTSCILSATKAQVERRPPYSFSACPGKCAQFGVCNPEIGRCDCLKNMTGADCSVPASANLLRERCEQGMFVSIDECLSPSLSCLNNCNYRGTCHAGFCLCNPGHYGADCSLSLSPDGTPQLLASTSYTVRQKRPWVYVYELPPDLTTWTNNRRLDRPTHNMFLQRLLSAGARTADPYQADWFYIPLRQRGFTDRKWLVPTLQYVNKTWPYWQQFGAHRHFMFHTGDFGWGEADRQGVALAGNITWLTHWGLYRDHEFTGWRKAHRPGKDIVVPVFVTSGHYRQFGMHRTPLHPNYQHDVTRNKTFFFAGRICGHRRPPDTTQPYPYNCGTTKDVYSAGVRQKVHAYHYNRTGFQVDHHSRHYARALETHQYCLAPLGGGHGQRQILTAFMGCIPVTIGDHVYQPFEPELPWDQFSVPVPESDIPTLHDRLAAVTATNLTRLQRTLHCAAQHLLWSSITGGMMGETGKYDAFETTLEILRVKLLYPNAQPHEYMQLDADFRRFMACGGDSLNQAPTLPNTQQDTQLQGSSKTVKGVCSQSTLDTQQPPSCQVCVRGSSPTHGYPGGLICCGHKRNLANCPRTWD